MKIDETSINHNTIRLIAKAMETLSEAINEGKNVGSLTTLGYITGVLEMRKELLEVMKL